MGATNGRIVGMILLQATVVGLLGYGMGVGLAALFGDRRPRAASWRSTRPGNSCRSPAVAVVLICILASLLSVRKVMVLEPAVVFRG